MACRTLWQVSALVAVALGAQAASHTETNDTIILSSSRLSLQVNKTLGAMTGLQFDGIDVLGPVSGRIGMDYVGQSGNASFEVHSGNDTDNTPWVGLTMSESYALSGQSFQQWWFLRDGEQGYHTFTRMQFDNGTSDVNLGNLQEFRQVISPNTPIWTHLVTNDQQYGHLPSKAAIGNETSDYFTKYEWADLYGDHRAHGFYADGSGSNGTQLGFWQVFNNLEGYTGGPLRSDLVVDTNIYNCASTINITSGFDRIFGPSFVYLNRDGDVLSLNTSFASDFYDQVADLIPGYVPSSKRGTFNAKVSLPDGAQDTKLVLAQNGVDFQDNVDYSVFGQYEKDDVVVAAGDGDGAPFQVDWSAESHGTELWRIGVPDKVSLHLAAHPNAPQTAGEYRHGFAQDQNHTMQQDEYRQYWGVYDFPTDFPEGINYTIGVSDPATDWNYVHYSRYGGTRTRPGYVLDNVNVWTVNWQPEGGLNTQGKNATLTVQLVRPRLTSAADPAGGRTNRIGFHFPGEWLKNETNNVFEFALPYNASGGDVNFRNYSISVLYDAIRLELA
ncbi:hypothetical protein IAU60_004357 [Kwoniella sp. DSM 27419]